MDTHNEVCDYLTQRIKSNQLQSLFKAELNLIKIINEYEKRFNIKPQLTSFQLLEFG